MMAERGNLRRVATPGARRWSPESSTAGLEDETTTSQATAIERLRSEMATVSKQQEEVLAALKRTRGPFRRMLYFLYGTDAATEQVSGWGGPLECLPLVFLRVYKYMQLYAACLPLLARVYMTYVHCTLLMSGGWTASWCCVPTQVMFYNRG